MDNLSPVMQYLAQYLQPIENVANITFHQTVTQALNETNHEGYRDVLTAFLRLIEAFLRNNLGRPEVPYRDPPLSPYFGSDVEANSSTLVDHLFESSPSQSSHTSDSKPAYTIESLCEENKELHRKNRSLLEQQIKDAEVIAKAYDFQQEYPLAVEAYSRLIGLNHETRTEDDDAEKKIMHQGMNDLYRFRRGEMWHKQKEYDLAEEDICQVFDHIREKDPDMTEKFSREVCLLYCRNLRSQGSKPKDNRALDIHDQCSKLRSLSEDDPIRCQWILEHAYCQAVLEAKLHPETASKLRQVWEFRNRVPSELVPDLESTTIEVLKLLRDRSQDRRVNSIIKDISQYKDALAPQSEDLLFEITRYFYNKQEYANALAYLYKIGDDEALVSSETNPELSWFFISSLCYTRSIAKAKGLMQRQTQSPTCDDKVWALLAKIQLDDGETDQALESASAVQTNNGYTNLLPLAQFHHTATLIKALIAKKGGPNFDRAKDYFVGWHGHCIRITSSPGYAAELSESLETGEKLHKAWGTRQNPKNKADFKSKHKEIGKKVNELKKLVSNLN